ncbi:MAG: HAD family hydrolase [Sedimentisphaerales bacterium]|nr:HAD family hydrolase [Sedimentisphaerales bacterium]MBN2813107.1 HAD family hydrolase [Bacteroidales bacterium]
MKALLLEKRVEGIVSVTDKIKDTSAKAIQELQKLGVKVFMLTGDNELLANGECMDICKQGSGN